jgi:hypothetical protein
MIKPLNDTWPDQQSTSGIIARWFESFDRAPEPQAVAAPADVEAVPTDVETARQEGWNEGFLAAGRAGLLLSARASGSDAAALLTQLETLDQRMDGVAEAYATAISAWLIDVLDAVAPSLMHDEMTQVAARTAAVLHRTLRCMTGLEVRADGGAAISCSSAEEAWRQLMRLRDETPAAQAVSICWPNGSASFDQQRTWAEIRAAIMPQWVETTGNAEAAFARLPERVVRNGG